MAERGLSGVGECRGGRNGHGDVQERSGVGMSKQKHGGMSECLSPRRHTQAGGM